MKKRIACALLAMLALVLLLVGCRDNSVVSGSDAPAPESKTVWEEMPDDERYIESMRAKMGEYISLMAQLSSMERTLSALDGEEKILANENFCAVAGAISDWCEGAYSYPMSSLESEEARIICSQICELAGATAEYIELLPSMLSGSYKGELTMEEYQNSIVDSAILIYDAVC